MYHAEQKLDHSYRMQGPAGDTICGICRLSFSILVGSQHARFKSFKVVLTVVVLGIWGCPVVIFGFGFLSISSLRYVDEHMSGFLVWSCENVLVLSMDSHHRAISKSNFVL